MLSIVSRIIANLATAAPLHTPLHTRYVGASYRTATVMPSGIWPNGSRNVSSARPTPVPSFGYQASPRSLSLGGSAKTRESALPTCPLFQRTRRADTLRDDGLATGFALMDRGGTTGTTSASAYEPRPHCGIMGRLRVPKPVPPAFPARPQQRMPGIPFFSA